MNSNSQDTEVAAVAATAVEQPSVVNGEQQQIAETTVETTAELSGEQSAEQTSQPTDTAETQQPKKNKYLKCNYKFCKNYDDLTHIVKSLPNLAALQTPLEVEQIPNALCYVIRSNNDDDVHKAIKYGIWTSVPVNNIRLNQAYEAAVQQNVDVYLFFSVVKSGQFIGVAKLKSSFQEETFSYWWQPHKFKGHFKIEWVFVKDVKQKAFEGLKNCQNDDISRSKDCTELKFETTGKRMLQIYKEAPARPSIFQDFQFLDQKELVLRNAYNYLGRQSNKGMNNGYGNSRNNNQNGQMFQNMFMNSQMANQGQMYAQYTPEQLNQFSQMCFTNMNIYPPNSFQQYNTPFMMGNNTNASHGKNYHHNANNNGANVNANNTNGHNNNGNGNRRNYNNKKPHQNKDKNQNQQPTEVKSEQQQV